MADRTSSDAGAAVDWSSYYKKTGERPPRPTLVGALDAFAADGMPSGGRAVDLGCGSGRDTIEILRRGWPVLAVDAEPDAIAKLLARSDLPKGCEIETLVSRYEDMALPRCDLVNAGFSLPLCPADAFPDVWAKIVGALLPGGRFSGQLYGDRDDWVDRPGMTCLSREEVVELLEPFEVELLEEEEDDSVTPRGVQKHWHIFHIVARKR
jgi:tellurite methyltransferase